jgi:integrase
VRPQAKGKKVAPGQGEFWSPVAPEVQAYANQVADEMRDPCVPAHQREWIGNNLSLRQFYSDWMLADRQKRVESGALAAATLEKDLFCLSQWERFSRPKDWQDDKPWPGFPIGKVTGRYLDSVLNEMRQHVSPGTVTSTWNHLRTILNFAARIRAIDKAPRPGRRKTDDREVSIFRDEQIVAAFGALAGEPDLQVAFVLAVNAGIRPVDLFCLRWRDFDLATRPTVTFRSRKTGKLQKIPLAPVTVAHIQRLPREGSDGMLFPGRSSPEAKFPERSKPSRNRRLITKRLFAKVGIHFEKPSQVARATCNTRLNRVREGAGVFVLGHGLTLNAKSYTEPSDLVREAVLAVEQPACFFEGLSVPN